LKKEGESLPGKLTRNDLNLLDDSSLIWTCIEPEIQKSRGKDFKIKSAVYSQLTAGQRALFMAQVLFGHTSEGVSEFYSHLDYLLVNSEVWIQLKSGVRYFGANEMTQLLEEMEILYHKLKRRFAHGDENLRSDFIKNLEDKPELSDQINSIDEQLQEIIPGTRRLIGAYIRNNPGEFLL
jgi:hypothetical protein